MRKESAMQNLEVFKKAHKTTTYFVGASSEYRVEIETPDLSGSPSHCWGDWGPMYTLLLSEGQLLRVTYHSVSRHLSASYELRPKYVELNTPMFAEVREKFPAYLEFEDEDRCLRFLLYFGHHGEVAYTEVERSHPDVHVDPLIFAHKSTQRLSA